MSVVDKLRVFMASHGIERNTVWVHGRITSMDHTVWVYGLLDGMAVLRYGPYHRNKI